MKLIELLDNLDALHDDAIIFIPRGNTIRQDLEAITGPLEEYGEYGIPPDGFEYFLEVFTAKEALQVWRDWRNGKIPDKYEKYQAILYYVEHDAYLPIE
jgi:ABC-type glycerol-3-phosphate transport system substrate-binding protein